MLINSAVNGDIAWTCERCEAMLNIQKGLSDECGGRTCTECGYQNKIDQSELYVSDDEYRSDISSSYKGLSDEDVIELKSSTYVELLFCSNPIKWTFQDGLCINLL